MGWEVGSGIFNKRLVLKLSVCISGKKWYQADEIC